MNQSRLSAAAAAMLLALGLGVGAQQNPASASSVPREYVRVEQKGRSARQATKRKRRGAHRRAALKSEPWQKLRGGAWIDGRGDYRSPKRLLRRRLEAHLGHRLSGRQWVRWRKQMRREGVLS